MSNNPYKDFYEASKRSDVWTSVDRKKHARELKTLNMPIHSQVIM